MRLIITISFLFILLHLSAQFSPPKDFRRIAGENLSGEDDMYTNSTVSFNTYKPFRDFNYTGNNTAAQKRLSQYFGFPFYITRDSLCWGTGKFDGYYSYVVVDSGGELVELSAAKNGNDFKYYSGWLLSTVRQYRKTGRSMAFPIPGKE